MLVNLVYGPYADVIDVPDKTAADLQSVKVFFDRWVFDERNSHPFWILDNSGRRYAVDLTGEAFVYWLNSIVALPETPRAEIKEKKLTEYDPSLPTIRY